MRDDFLGAIAEKLKEKLAQLREKDELAIRVGSVVTNLNTCTFWPDRHEATEYSPLANFTIRQTLYFPEGLFLVLGVRSTQYEVMCLMNGDTGRVDKDSVILYFDEPPR